jgi:glyoxylate reductase
MRNCRTMRVAVTSSELSQEALELLSSRADVMVASGSPPVPRDELLALVAEADAVVSMLFDQIDAAVLDRAPRLRVVANVAVGYDNIDVAAASRRGVWVTNTPDVVTAATAELTWALILAVARRIHEAEALLRGGAFRGWGFGLLLGRELRGRTLLVIGKGRIGSAVAEVGRAFGMVVECADSKSTDEALDAALRHADVVTLHVPLGDRTRHLLDARRLALLKPEAIVINTSRGPVVDEAALATALVTGRLGGAGLDVFEREPEVHPRLLEAPNTVLVPHIGSATRETRTAMAVTAARNVVAVLDGGRPPNAVNDAGAG